MKKLNAISLLCLVLPCFALQAQSAGNSNKGGSVAASAERQINELLELNSAVSALGKVAFEDTEKKVTAEPGKSSEKKPSIVTGPKVGFVPEEALKKFRDKNEKQGDDVDLQNLYEFAFDQQRDGFYVRAINAFEQIIIKKPSHEKAKIALGKLQIVTADYAGAVKTLLPLTRFKDSHWSVWYWLGRAYLQQNDLQLAAHCIEVALTHQPEDAKIWLLRGVIEQERGDHLTALQLLNIAYKYAPNNPTILLNMALSSEAIGSNESAMQLYTRYLQELKVSDQQHTVNTSIIKRISRLDALARN